MVFWGLKHTILLNILFINHMVCRYNKLCPCVRNTRDMVLFMMIYSDQKTRNSRKHINDCERAEILALLRRKQVILLNLVGKNSVQYVLVLVDLFRNTYV